MRKELYDDTFLREQRLACKEAAGWQCEAILSSGERCETREGDEKWSRRTKRKWIVYLHAAHLNNDPENPTPELMCLCPSCHMQMDRQKEQTERISQRRRGYELTSTDRLTEAVASAGLILTPVSEGYHWHVEGTEFEGMSTTAVNAVTGAIARLRTQLVTQADMPRQNPMPRKRTPNQNRRSQLL